MICKHSSSQSSPLLSFSFFVFDSLKSYKPIKNILPLFFLPLLAHTHTQQQTWISHFYSFFVLKLAWSSWSFTLKSMYSNLLSPHLTLSLINNNKLKSTYGTHATSSFPCLCSLNQAWIIFSVFFFPPSCQPIYPI